MSAPSLTLADLKKLNPCIERFEAVAPIFKGNKFLTARDAVASGVSLDDLVWVASAIAHNDADVERRLRLWMADCAARVLPVFEKFFNNDPRPRNAIIAARQFARGKITAAAWAAAWDAAGDAARDAAWAAARAAAWDAAGDAARDAAWAAAWAAAGDAARDAAWGAAWAAAWAAAGDAARDAAWAAARAAAWAAAWGAAWGAAWAAAWAAARAAARDAAWAAAWDAEEKWQLERLADRLSEVEPADWPLADAPAKAVA